MGRRRTTERNEDRKWGERTREGLSKEDSGGEIQGKIREKEKEERGERGRRFWKLRSRSPGREVEEVPEHRAR